MAGKKNPLGGNSASGLPAYFCGNSYVRTPLPEDES